jgi:hypothetical protein
MPILTSYYWQTCLCLAVLLLAPCLSNDRHLEESLATIKASRHERRIEAAAPEDQKQSTPGYEYINQTNPTSEPIAKNKINPGEFPTEHDPEFQTS